MTEDDKRKGAVPGKGSTLSPGKGWTKSLDDAGLLDEVEDSWELKSDPETGSTITVNKKSSAKKDKPSDKEAARVDSGVPFAIPIPSEAPEDFALPPLTPLESMSPKDDDDSQPKKFSPRTTMKSVQPEDNLPVPRSLDTTKFGDAVPIPDGTQRGHAEARISEGPVVTVRGKRISVPPEKNSPGPTDSQNHIVDLPREAEEDFRGDDLEAFAPDGIDAGGDQETEKTTSSDPLGLVEMLPDEPDSALEMRERQEMGDFSGALKIAEKILKERPGDVDAIQCEDESRRVLLQMYESRIGSMDRVPKLLVSSEEIIWHNLDPQAGFIISQIDGVISYEDILDISSMPKFETCQILDMLLQDGLIE